MKDISEMGINPLILADFEAWQNARTEEEKAAIRAREEAKRKEAEEKAKADEEAGVSAIYTVPDAGDQEPVSVVWEVNGRTEPHKVWIFPDGSSPENGLCISIDRFGAAKVLGGDEEDD